MGGKQRSSSLISLCTNDGTDGMKRGIGKQFLKERSIDELVKLRRVVKRLKRWKQNRIYEHWNVVHCHYWANVEVEEADTFQIRSDDLLSFSWFPPCLHDYDEDNEYDVHGYSY